LTPIFRNWTSPAYINNNHYAFLVKENVNMETFVRVSKCKICSLKTWQPCFLSLGDFGIVSVAFEVVFVVRFAAQCFQEAFPEMLSCDEVQENIAGVVRQTNLFHNLPDGNVSTVPGPLRVSEDLLVSQTPISFREVRVYGIDNSGWEGGEDYVERHRQ